jgi:hypothetical protein
MKATQKRCAAHPKYRAMCRPTGLCPMCHMIWRDSQQEPFGPIFYSGIKRPKDCVVCLTDVAIEPAFDLDLDDSSRRQGG